MPLAASTAPTVSSPVDEDLVRQQLAVAQQSQDFLRRIHWWVRLFGVAWLAGILLTVLGFLTVFTVGAYRASRDATRIESPLDTVTTTTNDTSTTPCYVFDPSSHQWRDAPCD
jgi:hypothetical protein